jgi:ribosomal protein S18 acetylase RimI-like enzyme
MTLLIRPATPADAETIHAALLAMGELLGSAHKIASTPDILARDGLAPGRAFEGLVAELDGAFAGMCLYLPVYSTWLGRPGIYVQDLYVDARFRGMKVGEALIRRVARIGRDRGATHLRLAVDLDNPRAQGFYTRLGVTHYPDDRIHAAYGVAFEKLSEEDER